MRKTLFIYYVLALFFVAGFFTHTSYSPEILLYSKKYFFILIGLTVLFLGVIPYLLNRFLKTHSLKELFFASLPTILLLTAIYTACNLYYYSQQEHLFDPFLQVPPSTYYYETPKDTQTVRVLCLGGSTTRFINADSIDRYPAILQHILDKRQDGKKYEVLNAGMDWYTTKHSLINYAAYCRNFEADIVVVMHAINDIYRSFSPEGFAVGKYEKDYSHFYGPSINGAKPKSFLQVLNKQFRNVWFGKNLQPRYFETSEYIALPQFEDYLSQLVELIQQDGATPFLVSQGHLYKENLTPEENQRIWMSRTFCIKNNTYADIKSLADAMDIFNATTKKVATKYQIPFIDADPILIKNLEYFVDDVHYTTFGSTKLAELIAKNIVPKQPQKSQ